MTDMAAIKCPFCGNTETVQIIYGYPTHDLSKQELMGKIYLGGCEVSVHNPSRYCNTCQKPFGRKSVFAFSIISFEFTISGLWRANISIVIRRVKVGWSLSYRSRDGLVEKYQNKKIDALDWVEIWKKIEHCYIEDWKRNYDSDTVDGTQWDLDVLTDSGVLIKSFGSNVYPVYYKRLCNILSKVIGEKIE